MRRSHGQSRTRHVSSPLPRLPFRLSCCSASPAGSRSGRWRRASPVATHCARARGFAPRALSRWRRSHTAAIGVADACRPLGTARSGAPPRLPGPCHAKRRSSTSCGWPCSSRLPSSGSPMRRGRGRHSCSPPASPSSAPSRPARSSSSCWREARTPSSHHGSPGRSTTPTPTPRSSGYRCRRLSRSRRPSRFALSSGGAPGFFAALALAVGLHRPESRRRDRARGALVASAAIARDRGRFALTLLAIVAPMAVIARRMVGGDPASSASVVRDRGLAAIVAVVVAAALVCGVAMLDRR